MDALGLEPGLLREPAQDEECARAGERPAARVQEEVRAVAAVEVGAAEREVAANGLGGRAAERDEPLLSSLADDADDAVVEVDGALLEADRLGHAQPGSVQKLDERAVPERARRRAGRGVDQPLGLDG